MSIGGCSEAFDSFICSWECIGAVMGSMGFLYMVQDVNIDMGLGLDLWGCRLGFPASCGCG